MISIGKHRHQLALIDVHQNQYQYSIDTNQNWFVLVFTNQNQQICIGKCQSELIDTISSDSPIRDKWSATIARNFGLQKNEYQYRLIGIGIDQYQSAQHCGWGSDCAETVRMGVLWIQHQRDMQLPNPFRSGGEL